MYRYPVKLIPDTNDTIRVHFPDVPEAITFGETREEALAHSVDALETALSGYIALKRDIPKPSSARGPRVELSAVAAAKLALYQEMRNRGLSPSSLGRTLKLDAPQVRKLIDINEPSNFDAVEAALLALGKRLSIELREAA